jgi:hypothetical protein
MIATTQQAMKSMTMAMARQDTATMMMATDVDVNNDDTASCEVAAH